MRVLKLIAFSTLLLACEPEIGDDCASSTDCSETGSRTCDSSMPGGYCTVFNCEPDDCPSEAACIGFMNDVSTAPECSDPSESRGLRTFCMRRCSNNDDCRSGYECLDLGATDNPWGAALVDKERTSGKVCALPYSAMPAVADENATASYCTAGTYVDEGYYDVAPAGEGGAGAGGGAAGQAGSGQGGASGGQGGAGSDTSGGTSAATAGATQ